MLSKKSSYRKNLNFAHPYYLSFEFFLFALMVSNYWNTQKVLRLQTELFLIWYSNDRIIALSSALLCWEVNLVYKWTKYESTLGHSKNQEVFDHLKLGIILQ